MESTVVSRASAISAPRRLRTLGAARPWTVAAATLVVYLAILAPLVSIHGADWFARVGGNHMTLSDRSARISHLRSFVNIGYDGQFAYYMALDPLNARYYMDSPSYRYGRVLYPAAASLTALGQPGAIPYTLLGINLLAIAATVWVLGAFLRRRGLSAWWAAVYGFFPGVMICLYADLTEPLAYCLAAAAIVLLLERTPPPIWSAGALFALAVLARETTLVFAFVGAAWLALRPSSGRRLSAGLSATLLVAVAVVPYGVYRLLVDRWLGTGLQEDNTGSPIPFAGFTNYRLDDVHRLILLIVIIPALIWLSLAAWSMLRSGLDVAAALIVANVALFVVWLPSDAYQDMRSAYRVLIPIVISALLFLPKLRRELRHELVVAAVLSLTLVWAVLAASLALL